MQFHFSPFKPTDITVGPWQRQGLYFVSRVEWNLGPNRVCNSYKINFIKYYIGTWIFGKKALDEVTQQSIPDGYGIMD